MINRLKTIDRTLLELLTGILLFGIVAGAAGMLFPVDRARYAIGFFPGIVMAALSAYHMWRSLDRAFSCDAKSAARMVAGGYAIRYLAAGAFLIILYLTDAGYVLAGFLGVMGLKIGAYLRPLTHKFYNRLFHEEDPVAQPLPEEEGDTYEGVVK